MLIREYCEYERVNTCSSYIQMLSLPLPRSSWSRRMQKSCLLDENENNAAADDEREKILVMDARSAERGVFIPRGNEKGFLSTATTSFYIFL